MRIWLLVTMALVMTAGACDRKIAGGRANGLEVYTEACARCHGAKGVPPRELAIQLGVRDLSTAEFQTTASDEDIRKQIVNGSEKKGMPAYGDLLSEAQITAVIEHVRSLAQ